MAINPKFYLKDPKAEYSLIYMGVKINSQELFKYSTSCKIIPELFDKVSRRPTADPKLIKEYKAIDPDIKVKLANIASRLHNLEEDASRIINELLRYQREVKGTELKTRLDEKYHSHRIEPKAPKSITFNKYLEEFIAKCETGEKLHGNKRYTKGTLKTYHTFQNTINEYKPNITFESVDMAFYNDFIQYLNKKKYSLNSVGKNIKFVKVIMRDAMENGHHSNLTYSFKDFRNVSEQTESVYLTEKELDTIYELDLSDKPNYDVARDVFLVGCYTALRFSDYSRIGQLNIKERNGRKYLDIITKKTNTLVNIPIKPRVMEILKKHNYILPHIWEQKLNLYIKEVCTRAKITEKVEVKTTLGGITKIEFKAKNTLVKTHTARRTGATLLYLAGVAPIDIMKITGHSKESNLLKYICVTKEETAERLAENSFFK